MGTNGILCCSLCCRNDFEIKCSLNPSINMFPPKSEGFKPKWEDYFEENEDKQKNTTETEGIKEQEIKKIDENIENLLTEKNEQNNVSIDNNINNNINNNEEEDKIYDFNHYPNKDEEVRNSLISEQQNFVDDENDNSQQNQDEDNINNINIEQQINKNENIENENEKDGNQSQGGNFENYSNTENTDNNDQERNQNNIQNNNQFENSEVVNSIADLMQSSQNQNTGFIAKKSESQIVL
jgi:hypothetical protein